MAFKGKKKERFKEQKMTPFMSDTKFNFVLCTQTMNNRPCGKRYGQIQYSVVMISQTTPIKIKYFIGLNKRIWVTALLLNPSAVTVDSPRAYQFNSLNDPAHDGDDHTEQVLWEWDTWLLLSINLVRNSPSWLRFGD